MIIKVVVSALLLLSAPAAMAQMSDEVVRIGVLTDLSSWGRDNAGPGSVEAVNMAIEGMTHSAAVQLGNRRLSTRTVGGGKVLLVQIVAVC